jgi:hypothetical protein
MKVFSNRRAIACLESTLFDEANEVVSAGTSRLPQCSKKPPKTACFITLYLLQTFVAKSGRRCASHHSGARWLSLEQRHQQKKARRAAR